MGPKSPARKRRLGGWAFPRSPFLATWGLATQQEFGSHRSVGSMWLNAYRRHATLCCAGQKQRLGQRQHHLLCDAVNQRQWSPNLDSKLVSKRRYLHFQGGRPVWRALPRRRISSARSLAEWRKGFVCAVCPGNAAHPNLEQSVKSSLTSLQM